MTNEQLTTLIETWDEKLDSLWHTDPNAFAVKIYDMRKASKINNAEYREIFDEYEIRRPEVINRDIKQRKDTRTLGELALDFYINEKPESIAEQWFKKYGNRHFPEGSTIEYGGVSKSGILIFEHSGKRRSTKKADFTVQPSDTPLESKACPCLFKATYKTADLRSYVKQEAQLLTLFSRHVKGESVEMSTVACYTLMSHTEIQKMLAENEEHAARENGFKPSIQMYIDADGEIGVAASELKGMKVARKVQPFAKKLQDFTKVYVI